jgi:hypothetical protein
MAEHTFSMAEFLSTMAQSLPTTAGREFSMVGNFSAMAESEFSMAGNVPSMAGRQFSMAEFLPSTAESHHSPELIR